MLSDLYIDDVSFYSEIIFENKILSIIKKWVNAPRKKCMCIVGEATSLLIKSFKFEFWI